MKPTLLVLTSTWPRRENDHEPRFVADLCERLTDTFCVLVLTQHRPNTALYEDVDGITIIRFRYAPQKYEVLSETGGMTSTLSHRYWTWCLVPLFCTSQIYAIYKVIRNYSPDVIHAHWLIPQGLFAVAGRFLARRKPALVCTSHGADIHAFRSWIFRFLKAYVIRSCDHYCVVSSSLKNEVRAQLSLDTKIEILPMGADLSNLFTRSTDSNVRIGQLLFVGRLVKRKGVKYLLHTLQRILEIDSSVYLVIVGHGPEKPRLQALANTLGISRKVRFLGPMTHSGIVRLYQQSEVCVLPFVTLRNGETEGLGLTVVEAIGCGCPVVAGDVQSVRDIIIDGETGLLCNPRQPEIMAEKIQSIRHNQALRSRLTETGYNHVKRNYSWSVCSSRYQKLLLSVTSINQ